MTPRAYLDAVRKRCEALTHDAGSWHSDDICGIVWAGPGTIGDGRVCDIRGWGHLTGRGGLGLDDATATAVMDARQDFIASARTDLPKLERIARLAEDYRALHLLRDPALIAARDALFAALESLP